MNGASTLKRLIPSLEWAGDYQRADLPGDLMGGLLVAIMLVPQSMGYAMIAGLPPEVGLYASIVPVVIYGILGSSRTLAVGPVAIVSLMTASALAGVVEAGTADYLTAAITLAFLSGTALIVMGIFRFGVLVNFLSHPVISGFTSAAAIVIALSQIRHLFGLSIPRGNAVETAWHLLTALPQANLTTVAIGVGSIVIILLMRDALARILERSGVNRIIVQLVSRSGPLLVVALGASLTAYAGLNDSAGLAIVGKIPAGLPPLAWPQIDIVLLDNLLPPALLIAFVGYLESISVAKALAAKKRQKINPDQELIGLGAANLAAAFTGGYPVTGGFSRSVVNFAAGANTPLASIITAGLIALAVVFLTPAFYFLPQAVLAAIIVVAVVSLIDLESITRAWRYNKSDGAAQSATIVLVLAVGIEVGILVGIGLSLVLYLWRTSEPHFAIVGRVPGTEHYRNVDRHRVSTDPGILLIRVDENLYFANAGYLESHIQHTVAERPHIEHLVLICSAVNFIDTSALETLENLIENLRSAGITLHLAEVKGPVMDKLKRTKFLQHLEPGEVFLFTHQAAQTLREELEGDTWYPEI